MHDYLGVLRARDYDKVITLSQNPRQCDLPGCGVMACSDLLDARYYVQYVWEIVPRVSEGGRDE